ncbi:MAG: glycosyltransferase [Steroidobacteraceae bacterium]
MKVAYFINQYPKVSHTFIRREILALETLGMSVRRYALRGWDAEVADPVDEAERGRTRYLLEKGVLPVLWAAFAEACRSPVGMLRVLAEALRMGVGGDRTLVHHLFAVAEGALLARWARSDGVKHVHAHFGTNSAEVCMYAQRLAGLSYSFTIHGPDEWDHPQQLHIREKVRHAKFVAAISHYTRAQVFRWVALGDQPKAHVIRCGLDDAYLGAPLHERPAQARIVCVGRLCVAKSQHLLVEVIARLKAEGLRVPLVLVGDGELRGVIEEQVRRHDLADLVTITGWASEEQVRKQIVSSSILVLPSLAEGLPVAIMEAMAMGRPVVSTYIAGIPELVEHEVNGWLCPAADIDGLKNVVRRAVGLTDEQWLGMAAAARQAVSRQHRVLAEAQKLHGLFRLALGDPP